MTLRAQGEEPKKRKAKRDSPTQHSLAHLRKAGMTVAVVEKWNPHAMIRQDLFGGIDILGIAPGLRILGIQACRNADLAARRSKILAEPRMKTWLQAGGRLVLHGWAVKGARGKRKTWTCREVELHLLDFSEAAP